MGLTRAAINRPLAILMLILGLVLMGGVAYTKMRQDRFPAISFPFVSVNVTLTGASPSDVEDLLAKPLEDAVAGVAGVQQISSTSREGSASVNIQLVEGTDTNIATQDIERRLAAIRSRLPDDASAPTVRKADTAAFPVMNVALSGKRPLTELYDLGNDVVLPKLQSVNGVADVQLVGGLQREIQVKVDSARLRAYGLSLQQVSNALNRENVNVPGGRLTEGGSSVSVRTSGLYKTVDDIKSATIVSGPGLVRLQDVATVTDTYADQTRIQRLDGKDAVGFIITKQSDANGVQVSDDIRAILDRTKTSLPRDITLQVTNDTAIFTRRSLDAVLADLKLAVILTALVLLVFLHTWRPTAIVLLAIPTSLISTFLIMYFAGFSLNMFSLMALALSIGILVDDSIVVLENIERHVSLGEPARQAALAGRSEIGLAAIAITMVDVVVYLPVSFMTGNIGRLFREFGITMATATLFSLFISFTMTPMLASRFLKHQSEHSRSPLAVFGRYWEAGYNRLARVYRRILNRALSRLGRPLIVLAAALTLFAAFQMLALNLVGSEYVPQEDDSQFSVSLTTPPGTSLAGTDAVAREVESRLQKLPEVQTVFTSVGAGGGNTGNTRNSTLAVELKDKKERARSITQVLGDVRRWSGDFPGVQLRASVSNPLGGGGGSSLNLRLVGDDLDTLTNLAAKYEAIIRNTPGAVDVNNDSSQRDPELRAVVNRQRLSDLNVSASTVASALKTAVGGDVVTELKPDGTDQIDVRVLASDADRVSPNSLGAMPLLTDAGSVIRLDQVATLTQDSGPAEIQRSDRQRVISVSGNASGRPIGDLARDIRAATAAVQLPEGYRVTFGGQVQQQETAFATLLGTLVLSVVLVYMLMVALYESLLTPLAILFSIPVALVGAIVALYVSQNTFNIFSLIGCIMLMGLVGKNAILLVDYTNTLRQRGLGRHEALLEAGYVRLRPIAMTTSTIIFAMLPLALKLEAGGESRAPMAVVIIGGVISSTLLSLLLVPVMYTLLEDAKLQVGRLVGWRPAWRRRTPQAVPTDVVAPGHAAPASRHARVDTLPIQGGATDD
jgi:hydrophobic/amphiphilic exporter-1 (mainly G- bacteria), HAE1 family